MVKQPHLLTALAVAGLLAGAGYAGYRLGLQHGMAAATTATTAATPAPLPQSIAEGEAATRRHIAQGIQAGTVDPVTGRKVLYYHDPMVPGQRFERPAKSPFMDMMLVPMYAGGDGAGDDGSTVTVSPRMQQNLGMRTAEVTQGLLPPHIAAAALLVPTEAVIATGQRVLVMLAEDQGRFRPVEVETGIESKGQTEIKRGLQLGQRVVVSGQFLLDSEASLRGIVATPVGKP